MLDRESALAELRGWADYEPDRADLEELVRTMLKHGMLTEQEAKHILEGH